jgi:hypothetical protein
MVTGLLHPLVLLPSSMRTQPIEELRLAVAHELAHVRRGDLWLGWIPALAEALFWFHPLVARAADEYSQACEEACDAEALRATGVDPYDYGRLLLALGVHHRWHGVTAMPCGSHDSRHLSRRLSRLTPFAPLDPRLKRAAIVLLSGFALVGLAPLRVVPTSAAQPAVPAAASLTVVTVDPAAAADHAAETVETVEATADPDGPAADADQDSKQCASSRATCDASEKACSESRTAAAPEPPAAADVDAPAEAPIQGVPALESTPPDPPGPPSSGVAAIPAVPATPAMPRPSAYAYGWSGDDKRQSFSYVLVRRGGESSGMTGSGNAGDWQDVAALKEKLDHDFLWARTGDRRYLIEDPELLRRVEDAFAPETELGKRQSELGSMQSQLGEQQSRIGEQQSRIGEEQSQIGAEQSHLASEMARRSEKRMSAADLERRAADLSDQMDELGRTQERLSTLMVPLSEQQEKLGAQMEVLSRQMAQISRQATREVRALIDAAIRDGQAKPYP